MKKNLFLILVSTLFILVLIYLYDEKEEILNREYLDYENNIFIDYPYFNNVVIDNYLNDYLEPYINQANDLVDLLFIDYDLEDFENKIKAVYGNKFLLETFNSEKEYLSARTTKIVLAFFFLPYFR